MELVGFPLDRMWSLLISQLHKSLPLVSWSFPLEPQYPLYDWPKYRSNLQGIAFAIRCKIISFK